MSIWWHDLAANTDVRLSAKPGALTWRVLIMVMRRRRTYGGGNVLSKGVFIDIISHAQAQGRMSLGCDELLSKAKCDAEGRTNIHEEVEGYDPEHPSLYYVGPSQESCCSLFFDG